MINNLVKFICLVLITTFLNAADLNHADSYTDAIQKGIKENKLVVLFTHTPFCPYCVKMEEDTLSNPEVINLLNQRFIFISVDLGIDIETEDVPRRFIPRGTPTTFIIDPKTPENFYNIRGYVNAERFLGILRRL